MARIGVIAGDGIGIDVVREGLKVVRAADEAFKLGLSLTEFDYGAERYLKDGVALPTGQMDDFRKNYDAIFLGAMGDPRVPGNEHARAVLLGLRFRLDLYINLRPARLFETWLSPLRDVRSEDVDLVIFRENTEGIYVGMGGQLRRGTPHEVAIEEDINTRRGVERIVRAAFDHARRCGRRRVTLTDKANAMPHTGGLWRRVFAEVGSEYPGIEQDAVYADALALDLVRRPARYDVIVAPNLFGDILSDLAAALVGGLGCALREPASGPPRPLRARPRLGAGHCGHRSGESDRGPAYHGADARPARLGRRGTAARVGGAQRAAAAPRDARPRRLALDRCAGRLDRRRNEPPDPFPRTGARPRGRCIARKTRST